MITTAQITTCKTRQVETTNRNLTRMKPISTYKKLERTRALPMEWLMTNRMLKIQIAGMQLQPVRHLLTVIIVIQITAKYGMPYQLAMNP